MKLLTTAEAAIALGLSVARVKVLCQAGRLGTRYGRQYLITPAELATFRRKPRKAGRPRKKVASG
jgi:hypothetical protein